MTFLKDFLMGMILVILLPINLMIVMMCYIANITNSEKDYVELYYEWYRKIIGVK